VLTGQCRFEVQLNAVKERLELAKQGSTHGLGSPASNASFAFGGGSRIAKPLRGGGAPESAPVPTLANLQLQENGGNKRSSWFFNQRN
jgi:kinesin family protein 5